MSEVRELTPEDLAFLDPFMPNRLRDDDDDDLPYTTLTWAQSLDGKIALGRGVRTQLSGVESKSMTHYLRIRHDAILVGRATAEVDDPGLNSRYPGATLHHQPRPVVLDMHRRWSYQAASQSKVYSLAVSRQGRFPWRVSAAAPTPGQNFTTAGSAGGGGGGGGAASGVASGGGGAAAADAAGGAGAAAVETDGHDITTVAVPGHGEKLAWRDILRALKQQGINSVMIEGGGQVIQELLTLPHLVDAVIITVAPTFLGSQGVSISPPQKTTSSGHHINAAWIRNAQSRHFGNDIVVCGRLG